MNARELMDTFRGHSAKPRGLWERVFFSLKDAFLSCPGFLTSARVTCQVI